MQLSKYIYDRYERGTRLYPAILTTVPIILLVNFYANALLANVLSPFVTLIIGDVPLSAVFIFLLIEANKFLSKEIVQKIYFKDEQKFPTTNILLIDDKTLSEDYKNEVHKKILNDFHITLLSKREEEANEKLARQKMNEAISCIREKMRPNEFVKNENIHYGFLRNLIGGAFIALPISIFDIIIFANIPNNEILEVAAIISLVFFALLLLSSKYLLASSGKNYAKTLINNYYYHSL